MFELLNINYSFYFIKLKIKKSTNPFLIYFILYTINIAQYKYKIIDFLSCSILINYIITKQKKRKDFNIDDNNNKQ